VYTCKLLGQKEIERKNRGQKGRGVFFPTAAISGPLQQSGAYIDLKYGIFIFIFRLFGSAKKS